MERDCQKKPSPLSRLRVISDVAGLTLTTVVLLGVFVASYLANVAGGPLFQNTTAQVSNKYFTQVTPANFTFAIWGVIYIWQGLWLAYAWSFLCRPKTYRTIFTGVYIGYAAVNALNMVWLYAWGNHHITAALALLFALNLAFYPTIGILVGYFYRTSSLSDNLDKTLTWIFPINGLFLYATWTTIASLVNLSVVLEYTTTLGIDATTSGTISLSLLLATLIIYFALENTVLFNVLRYVLSVYPVVIWALSGEVAAHWGASGEERNSRFSLGLLVVAVVAFIFRIVRVTASVIKPPRRYKALPV